MAITLRSVATIALERLWFFCQINLIPNAINRILAYSHFLFGSSYALTIAGWVFIYAILRAFYVLVLYPVYFTPYRHLPAPKVTLLVHRCVRHPTPMGSELTISRAGRCFGAMVRPCSPSHRA